MAAITKHRLSMSEAQMDHMIRLCQAENPISYLSISCMGYLGKIMADITVGDRVPAYVKKNIKPNIVHSLGFGIDPDSPNPVKIDWEIEREKAYKKHSNDIPCTAKEVKLAQQYMLDHPEVLDEAEKLGETEMERVEREMMEAMKRKGLIKKENDE